MDALAWEAEPPQLRSPVLVCAFAGWNDAAGSATTALTTAAESLEAVTAGPEEARLLHRAVVERPELEPLPAPPQLSIVPFRHVPPGVADVDAHNCEIVRRIQEGGEFWVAHARIDGRVYVRPCLVNFRTTEDDVLAFVEQVERIGRELAA